MDTIGKLSSIPQEHEVEWRIEDFSTLSMEDDKRYHSLVFYFANASWYLRIYPNGQKSHESIGYISVFLVRKSSGPPISLDYTLILNIMDEKRDEFVVFEEAKHVSYVFKEPEGHGWTKFMKRYEFLKRRSDLGMRNVVTVICKMKCLEMHDEVPTNDASKRKLEKDYEELLLSGENSDVTLDVNSKKIKCHRSILGARSPVFSAMFKHDMKEKLSGVVNIQDAEPTIFQEFLLYLYTGSEEYLNWENVTELYRLADRYAMEDLKKISVQYMKNNISTKNFLAIFHLSQQHDEPELSEKIIPFFLENSKNIVESSEWLTFLCKNPAECNVLFQAALAKK